MVGHMQSHMPRTAVAYTLLQISHHNHHHDHASAYTSAVKPLVYSIPKPIAHEFGVKTQIHPRGAAALNHKKKCKSD